jgi:WD40 repeat protein
MTHSWLSIIASLAVAAAAVADDGKTERYFLPSKLPVLSVSPAPDGTHIALAVGDKSVRTFDVVKGKEVRSWPAHDHPAIHRVVYGPIGKGLYSCCEDSTIRRWDPDTGKQVREYKAHSVPVKSLAVSPDGAHVLSAGSDATLRLFEADTGRLVHTLRIEDAIVESPFRSIALAAGGKEALAGNAKGYVSRWDLETGKQLALYPGHKGEVTALAYLADGKGFVAAGDEDKTVRLWDIAEAKVTRTFDGHEGAVTTVAVSPDGTRLASGSKDESVRVWDLKTSRELHKQTDHARGITHVIFLGNDRVISTGEDGAFVVWHLPK